MVSALLQCTLLEHRADVLAQEDHPRNQRQFGVALHEVVALRLQLLGGGGVRVHAHVKPESSSDPVDGKTPLTAVRVEPGISALVADELGQVQASLRMVFFRSTQRPHGSLPLLTQAVREHLQQNLSDSQGP
eukprot:UN2641